MDDNKEKNDVRMSGVALTRREWLWSLGAAAALAGCSGAPGEVSAEQGATAGGSALPPGLYLPSPEHLAHALVNDNRFVPIPPGTETEYVRPRAGPFVPQAFAADDYAIIRRWVEIILGEDLKNSQAKPVPGEPATIFDEVAEWIDLVVASAPAVRAEARALTADQRAVAAGFFESEEPLRELETFEPETICREGLAWVREECRRRFSTSFSHVGARDQVELVSSVSDARQNSAPNSGTHFFDFLKAESIRGFYTSSRGLKELDYKGHSFYAESPGCALEPHADGGSEAVVNSAAIVGH